ncbi:hypothetical protein UFOVP1199_9 [uncultured Caudovirales phage]|uniref:Uncharacterized protein n=1 Tax=uncultured Caudovirales phage TaxID=2100421 RepID=A0A6J5QP40_9CAUD|nr:hypothetical protein UFOVP1137_21 [uncultured Caudovirales phage]CAB4189654.1 hypothetical protein UFOVP1199_9 [uncultured Caudovirales phage]CAB4194195.1 hypothetical protein UFOVP1257_8 [uncultured Caudovirales phage]CAB4216984.1 hypothetical protein UFOVP1498_6 [uncultured Caudovirales phage]CAB5231053.1 hypothetical protein UFOVP1587_20 [uncultured Caudovirales phage]
MSKELINPLAAVKVLQAIIDARHGLSRVLMQTQHDDKGSATESVGHITALHLYVRFVDSAIWGDGETGGVIIRDLDRGSDAGNP